MDLRIMRTWVQSQLSRTLYPQTIPKSCPSTQSVSVNTNVHYESNPNAGSGNTDQVVYIMDIQKICSPSSTPSS